MTEQDHQHFLDLALGFAQHSRDPATRVGALIVGPKGGRIRGLGHNAFPARVCETPERMNDREMKLRLIVHAEMAAVLHAARDGISVKGCTLYLAATDDSGAVWGGPPCVRCTVEIIEAGITSIVSRPRKVGPSKWHADLTLAHQILTEAGIDFLEVAP